MKHSERVFQVLPTRVKYNRLSSSDFRLFFAISTLCAYICYGLPIHPRRRKHIPSPRTESERSMNEDPKHIPDLSPLLRTRFDTRRRRTRPSVRDSIDRARSTLLINLIIEILAGLILLAGIVFTVKFLFDRRSALDPGRFKLYIEVMIFFTIGWLTYVGFKVRAKYILLRKSWHRPPEPPGPIEMPDGD